MVLILLLFPRHFYVSTGAGGVSQVTSSRKRRAFPEGGGGGHVFALAAIYAVNVG